MISECYSFNMEEIGIAQTESQIKILMPLECSGKTGETNPF